MIFRSPNEYYVELWPALHKNTPNKLWKERTNNARTCWTFWGSVAIFCVQKRSKRYQYPPKHKKSHESSSPSSVCLRAGPASMGKQPSQHNTYQNHYNLSKCFNQKLICNTRERLLIPSQASAISFNLLFLLLLFIVSTSFLVHIA